MTETFKFNKWVISITFQNHGAEVVMTSSNGVPDRTWHPCWEHPTELIPSKHPVGIPDDVREGLYHKIAEKFGQPSDE
jgi:hypothetical protein